MGIAKARRIARRAHRGQLTDSGELFSDHLELLARAVEVRGGGWVARQAVWLHAVPATGVDLARLDLPWRVLRVVEALQPEHAWSGPVLARVRQFPDAVLVHEVLQADRRRVPPASSPALPVHVDELPELLAAHRESGRPEICARINALFSRPIDPVTPAVVELVGQWWDSADGWESAVAVRAAGSAGLLAREPLLRKVAGDSPIASRAAVEALSGEGDRDEIAVLRTVVLRPEAEWRWARRAARRRLTAIGGPDAEAALREWAFSPLDPPWHSDRTWARRNAAELVPRLIAALPDREWSHEAPLVLGELRSTAAVGPLCEVARTADCPVRYVEALGRIGSAEAVPTLVELVGHRLPEVRDHALRALAGIGGDAVVDAALLAWDDQDPVVRGRAARVLVRYGDGRAVTQLIHLCDTGHAAGAADALTRIGDARALPTLWHLFRHHGDKAVRHAAGRGLARIDGAEGSCFSGDVPVMRAFMWLLGHKPDWSRQRLVHGVKHGDALVRARAAEAWGRLGAGAEHVRPLLDDPDPRVRGTAKAALARLHDLGA
jgi:HEAT repeat protein